MTNFSGGILQRMRARLRSEVGPGPTPPPSTGPEDPAILRERKAEQAAVLRRFHPPALTWLGLGLLMAILQCCVFWQAILLTAPYPSFTLVEGDGWLKGILLPLVFLAAFYRGGWLAEWQRGEYWSVRAVALVGLALFGRLCSYLLNPPLLGQEVGNWLKTPILFFSLPFALNLTLFIWAYLGGEFFGRQTLNMFTRPHEVPYERGGTGVGGDFWNDRPARYRTLKNRLYFNGILTALTLAFLVVGVLRQPDDWQVETAATFVVLYIPVMLITQSWLRLIYLRTLWQVGELAAPVTLPRRWLLALLGFALAVGLLAAILPHKTDFVPKNWDFNVSQQLNKQRQQQQAQSDRGSDLNQRPAAPLQLPDWILPAFTWLIRILLALLVLFLLSKVPWGRFREWPRLLRFRLRPPDLPGLWRAFLAWWRSLFRRPAWDAEPVEKDTGGNALAGWFRRFRRGGLPDDPRAQVRYYYRQTLGRAARAGLPRRPTETPKEFARHLQTRFTEATEPTEADPRPDVESLRAVYEEARFSPHPIATDQAEQAATNAAHLGGALRQVGRKKNEK